MREHEATEATAKGFAVTLVDDAMWGAMTAAQFADYQLLVVGDPDLQRPARRRQPERDRRSPMP